VEGRLYVLPAEAQWEFACRAGTTGDTYGSSGETLADLAVVSEHLGPFDNEQHRPRLGGTRRANAFGLFDMLGNVWEHCSDWHSSGPTDGKLRTDPRGPSAGALHVLRGGAWYRSGVVFARASCRQYSDDGAADAGVGFRVALVGNLTGVENAGYRPGPYRFGPWRPLFNGRDLSGWQAIPPQSWNVKDGVIHGSGRQAFLATSAADIEDFHLRAEFRINAEGDSGIHFRSPPPDPNSRYGYQISGLEAELGVRNSPNHRTGAVTIKDRPGHVLVPASQAWHGPDEWQTLEIKARGEYIEIHVNEQLVTDCRDAERKFRRGHIALASWEDDRIKTNVEFRKVEIRTPTAGLAESKLDVPTTIAAVIDPRPLLSEADVRSARRIKGWCASWSPDGKRLVRSLDPRNHARGLEIVDLESGTTTFLATGGKDPAWSPIAEGPIAFVRGPELAKEELWLVDPDGANLRRIAGGGFPTWTVDGRLFYRSFSETSRQCLIRAIKPGDAGFQYPTRGTEAYYPAVSPNGERVVVNGLRTRLFIGDQDSRRILLFSDPETSAWDGVLATWSPDGRYVTFGTYGNGQRRGLWILDTRAKQTRLLAAGDLTLARWSPDGKLLAADDRQRSEIVLLNLEHLNLARGLTSP
jgi:hypothetical protein